MNLIVEGPGGGVFSKFVISIQGIIKRVQKGFNIDDIENLYLNVDKARYKKNNKQVFRDVNPFDYVFEQIKYPDAKVWKASPTGSYKDMLNHPKINIIKKVVTKLKVKQSIIDKIDNRVNEKTLGIHIRLTDMNIMHGKNYGIVNFDNYLKKLEEIMKINNFENIFVASDNLESIKKLEKLYPVIYYKDLKNRSKFENDGDLKYQSYLRQNAFQKQLWEESFLEMLTLAKCGTVLKRMSNLNNTAIMFSDSITKVYSL